MENIPQVIIGFLTRMQVYSYVVVVFFLGVFLAYIVQKYLPAKKLHPQHQMILRRAVSYFILAVTISWTLRELGVSLSVLMGTAGILTVALGFASQTSASNLISGLFLLGERPFVMGDIIKVGDAIGKVVSIDLLSVKLCTFDNLLVRIPNETMFKANVTNMTYYPIRRVDLSVGVAYKEDIQNVRKILFDLASKNAICLEEPKPLLFFRGYGDSSLDFQFSVWAVKDNFLELRNTMYEDIKVAFDKLGIEIPFPHRSLYTGTMTNPLPIRLVNGADIEMGAPYADNRTQDKMGPGV